MRGLRGVGVSCGCGSGVMRSVCALLDRYWECGRGEGGKVGGDMLALSIKRSAIFKVDKVMKVMKVMNVNKAKKASVYLTPRISY